MKPGRLRFEPVEPFLRVAGISLNRLQGELGINPSRARRWGLTLDQADRIADRVERHPIEIFGDWYLWLVDWSPPEDEPGGTFGGKPLWYRATGRNDWYGDPRADVARRALIEEAA